MGIAVTQWEMPIIRFGYCRSKVRILVPRPPNHLNHPAFLKRRHRGTPPTARRRTFIFGIVPATGTEGLSFGIDGAHNGHLGEAHVRGGGL
jgi:hypothetical protein